MFSGQATENLAAGPLLGWLDAYFLQALQLAEAQSFVVEVPLLSTVKAALAHLAGAGTKHDFARGLAHGFGANMTSAGQQQLAAGLGRLTGEADLLRPVLDNPLALLRSEYTALTLLLQYVFTLLSSRQHLPDPWSLSSPYLSGHKRITCADG